MDYPKLIVQNDWFRMIDVMIKMYCLIDTNISLDIACAIITNSSSISATLTRPRLRSFEL